VGSANAPVNHSRVSALNPARGSVPAPAPAVLAPSAAGARGGAALPLRVFAGMHPSCLAPRTVQPGRQHLRQSIQAMPYDEKHRMTHRTAHGWRRD